MTDTQTIRARAQDHCELCGSDAELTVVPVPPRQGEGVLLCGCCSPQVGGDTGLDPKHWFCLQESAWSAEPAVQVVAWRLLQSLRSEGWALELVEQLYLEDDTLAWAQAGGPKEEDAQPACVDSNGTALQDGDNVTLIKSLDVKGSSLTAKRGSLVRNIRLGDDPELIVGKVQGVTIYLKTCFLKKSS